MEKLKKHTEKTWKIVEFGIASLINSIGKLFIK